MESLVGNIHLLQIIRIVLFVGIFTFSTCYLIPNGIVNFAQWKATKSFKHLGSSVNFWSAGLFLMLYLLNRFIMIVGL